VPESFGTRIQQRREAAASTADGLMFHFRFGGKNDLVRVDQNGKTRAA
jgi:hypothetical protein